MSNKNPNRGPRGKILTSTIELLRQEFLSGETLRDLAEKHGISERAVASFSKAGGWQKQRTIQQSAATVPQIAAASDVRAQSVAEHWKTRLQGLRNLTTEIAERVALLLRTSTMDDLDSRELCTMMKLLADSMDKLNEIANPKNGSQSGASIIVRIVLPAPIPREIAIREFGADEEGSISREEYMRWKQAVENGKACLWIPSEVQP